MSENIAGFGIAPYQGYEYQIDATVWVGVDLLLARQIANALMVEPATGEDIAAELKVADPERTAVTVQLDAGTRQVQIQIKLRRSGQWTAAGLRDILTGSAGPTTESPRVRPLQYLQAAGDADAAFVLLTDAQAGPQVADFVVSDIANRSVATSLPEGCPGDVTALAPRVGILQHLTPELLHHRTRDLLHHKAQVPTRHLDGCIDALKAAVRDRLLGKRAGLWPREELVAIVKSHHGYPDDAAHARLVKPLNYAELSAKLAGHHALLLTGTPGSGKSLVSEGGLLYDLRQDGYDVVRVDVSLSPSLSRYFDDPHKTVFYLEDPWGNYRVESHAAAWVKELPKLLERATATKKFLITSRTGVAKEAFGSEPPTIVRAAEMTLTESNYNLAARAQVLDRRSAGLPPDRRDFVSRHRDRVLEQLRNPYELSMFVERVRAATAVTGNPDALIRASKTEFVGQTLAKEVKAGGRLGVVSGAILWLLFMLGSASDSSAVAVREHALAGGSAPAETDPHGLLQALLAAGWFERTGDRVTAHPTQIEGLEQLLRDATTRTAAEDGLRAVLTGLVTNGKLAVAVRAARQVVSRKLPIPPTVQAMIDQFMVRRCVDAKPHELLDAIHDLGKLSRASDPVSVLARALEEQPASDAGFGPMWSPPKWTHEVLSSVRDSAEARHIMETLLRHALPRPESFQHNHSELVEFVFTTLGWDLSGACEAGLEAAIEDGALEFDALLEGAARAASPPFDRLLDKALAKLGSAATSRDESEDWYRRAEQAELDAVQSDHLLGEPDDDYHVARHTVEQIVSIRRKREGFGWLLRHPRREVLLGAWARALRGGASTAEGEAFWASCAPTQPSLARQGLRHAPVRDLRGAVLADLRQGSSRDYGDIVETLGVLLLPSEWISEFVPTVASMPLDRRLTIAEQLLRFDANDAADPEAPRQAARAMFSGLEATVAGALLGAKYSAGPHSPPAGETLRQLARSEIPNLALAAAAALIAQGSPEAGELKRLLAHADHAVREKAVALASHELLHSLKAELKALLSDGDYRVRRATMKSLAAHADDADWANIIAMHSDRSGPVRQACALLIGSYGRPDGTAALIALLDDHRNSNGHRGIMQEDFGGGSEYRVARAAAEAIGDVNGLANEAFEEIAAFLRGGAERCDDAVVRYKAMTSLAKFDGPDLLPIFASFLLDPHYAGGIRTPGYPVRYAAAWGMVDHLRNSSEVRSECDPAPLVEPARHSDGRTAGPCLLALGMLLPRAAVECGNALPAGVSPLRAALVAIGAALAGAERRAMPVPLPSALSALLDQVAQQPEWKRADWQAFLSERPDIARWIEEAQVENDVGETLAWGLGQLCPELFKQPPERGDGHLPKVIGVISASSLAGCE